MSHSHDHCDDSDEDHDHSASDPDEDAEMKSLQPALEAARSGLRSQVQVLVEALPECHVYIPLSEDLPETPDGERVEIGGELTFRPHMILNQDESIFAVAYTDPQFVDVMQEALGWETSGGELKFVCVPAHVAFDLAQMDLDGDKVSGLVFNPGTDKELILQRDEVASIAQGTALPLVGYVSELEDNSEEGTQIVAGAPPPPAALIAALEAARESQKDLVDVKVHTTFNPERDREPHLSIILTVVPRRELNRQALADAVMEDAAPHLPPPGYADIVFRDVPN
jgi:hypothetical protein